MRTQGSSAPLGDTRRVSDPLKVVVLVGDGGLRGRFSVVLEELARRGHQVHVTMTASIPAPMEGLLVELRDRYPNVAYARGPHRSDGDGWRAVAWVVRGLGDLAHHAQAPFAAAPGLRERMEGRILRRLEREDLLEPAGLWLARRAGRRLAGPPADPFARRMIGLSRALEAAIPSSPAIDAHLAELDPDVVVATGTVWRASEEADVLMSARHLGVATGVCVSSWDSLTNKGLLKGGPDRVFVWNDIQAAEARELHLVAPSRIRVTGAPTFDRWFGLRPSRSAEVFARLVGLDPGRPYLAYLCSSKNTATGEAELAFVRRWIEAVRSSGDPLLERIGVLVRPHPEVVDTWRSARLEPENVAVWPLDGSHHEYDAQNRAGFYDTFAHCAAVVGINTTALIEAAILDKPVLTVLVPEFAQEATLHFRHLPVENGGFIETAPTLEEHVAQLRAVLEDDEAGRARRREFVRSFVRPHGPDRPAAGILADEIEALASVTPARADGVRRVLFRGLLTVEARLTARRSIRTGLPAEARG